MSDRPDARLPSGAPGPRFPPSGPQDAGIPPDRDQAPPGVVLRECDLKGCSSPGAAVVDINVSAYTGNPDSTLRIAVCQAHGQQTQAGFIAGFAWTPVYKHEVSKPAHPPAVPPEEE